MKIHKCNHHCITVNPLLSPPMVCVCVCGGGGAYLFQVHVRGGCLIETDRWFKTENTKWISSSTRRLEVMQPRIKNNSELPVGK